MLHAVRCELAGRGEKVKAVEGQCIESMVIKAKGFIWIGLDGNQQHLRDRSSSSRKTVPS